MPSFADFELLPPILGALANEGYTTPTPIQLQAIPYVLAGRDLCGIAQTGTGKTAAFALPILHRLAARDRPAAARRLPRAGAEPDPGIGEPDRRQLPDLWRPSAAFDRGRVRRRAARRAAAAPRRRRRHPRRHAGTAARPDRPGALSLSRVEILVLDEADRMLDLGFVHALRQIVKLLPRRRQTLLFSATMPRTIADSPPTYLDDPVKVSVAPAATTVERVEQSVIFVPSERKRDAADHLAARPEPRARAGVHPHQARRRPGRAPSGRRRDRGRGHPRQQIAAAARARARRLSQRRAAGCWSPPTSPRAASMSKACRTSSTSNCRTSPKIMCTASAERRAPAPPGIAISFCSDEERPYLRDIEKLTRLRVPVMPIPATARHAGDGPFPRATGPEPSACCLDPHRRRAASPPRLPRANRRQPPARDTIGRGRTTHCRHS